MSITPTRDRIEKEKLTLPFFFLKAYEPLFPPSTLHII